MWKPIDTAPRDGTPVLLWGGTWRCTGRFPNNKCVHACWFAWDNEYGGTWQVENAGYEAEDLDSPTYWMPLPEPPKELPE